MPDIIYDFFQSENEDGIDYLFYSKQNRLYTVSFDTSVYAEYVEQFPTLLKHGYGVMFSYTQSVPKRQKESCVDPIVIATIVEILHDFLKNNPDSTFIVYQCPGYKEHKLFNEWFKKSDYAKTIIKEGVTIEIDDETGANEYFGFMTTKFNTHTSSALQELQLFMISLSGLTGS